MSLSQYYLYSIIKSLNINTLWIALSGGRDSICLLDITYKSLKKIKTKNLIPKIYAIHINHYMNNSSENCEKFCIKYCNMFNIPLIIKRQKKYINNIELAARNFRYFWFNYYLNNKDVIFIAHNNDDQIENWMLKTMKGCGITGLSSIPYKRKMGYGFLLRPLLNISRRTINNYIKKYKLNWFEDKTNFNIKFDRNYLRHKIIPKLKNRWPYFYITLNKCIANFKESNQLLNEVSTEIFTIIGYNSNKIYINKLIKLSYYQLRRLIIYCLNHLGYINPSKKQINELINQIFNAKYYSSILIKFNNIEARIWKGFLYFKIFSYYKTKPENIFYSWDLYCINKFNKLNIKFFNLKGGEKIIHYGKIKRIKHLLQKLSIPPWERKNFIIIYYKETIVAAFNNNCSVVTDNWSAKIKIKYPF
ncbi:tRNA(Ile)-lysidine synthase [Candidatus Portiera aleyrodidarum]|uniref:tRNA(Ile)-lysidine synthase n=1 Tax=Candidatus Portiera aleyrodidarum TV TaxID=1297582 RepID=A0A8D3XAN3_9GAMM|nr:tRNA lysidine(34) synthetase TilS [Candidatus Portiera aleyrodidarum]AGI27024.1 tRNA(Ile)-lysidine synthetase [Candidatus Portiera aleyrodidarum TV]CEI58980.1 tRNA(Ile)-lysidine synthase [Candidatus Portiera aleyrodidarum]